MKVSVKENSELTRELVINFRVFDDGFGFRYEFPEQKNLKEFIIMDELTEFNFADDHKTWSIPYNTAFYEGLYKSNPISKLDTVATPLTMETKNGLFLTVHQANLTDYASMNLAGDKKSTKLKAYLTPWATGEKVFAKAPSTTPWRTVIIAKSAGDLMLSRLMLNLNEPNKLGDVSWIKPGRYIGIWWAIHMEKYTWKAGPNHGAKTENVLRYIDFAAKHNFSGVLVEGWNKGWEDWKDFQFSEPYPDFDIKKITDYAKSKMLL
jgi:alpha-glucosidase